MELKNHKALSQVPQNLSYPLAHQHFEDTMELLNVNIAPLWVCKCMLQSQETLVRAQEQRDYLKNKERHFKKSTDVRTAVFSAFWRTDIWKEQR